MWVILWMVLAACGVNEPAQSNDDLRAACEALPGDNEACLELGRRLLDSGEDAADGIRFIDRACKNNVEGACHELGGRYYEGNGVLKDLDKSWLAYNAGCGRGDDVSCAKGAVSAMEAGSLPTARRLADNGCRGGVDWSCRNLGIWHVKGELGEPQDLTAGLQAFIDGCKLDSGYCCWVASGMIEQGQGIDADPPRAELLMMQACSLGYAKGCSE